VNEILKNLRELLAKKRKSYLLTFGPNIPEPKITYEDAIDLLDFYLEETAAVRKETPLVSALETVAKCDNCPVCKRDALGALARAANR
jgi:hypothetical protein